MGEVVREKATICIINYKSLDFTRLCLRSIRKFTHYPYEIIVIDNNSADESLEYLKSLKWIRLIERNSSKDPSGGYSHAAALDLGLSGCNTEFFVSMHSDVFVIRDNWLTELIGYFGSNGGIACVGTGKIELTSGWRKVLKKAADFRTFKRKLFYLPDPLGKYRYYNRTICCLYRTGILQKEELSFLMDRDNGLTSGKKLYFELVDRGYKTVELPPSVFNQYVIHLAHATQVVNPAEFNLRKKTRRKCLRQLDRIMSIDTIRQLLSDETLDN